jgi:hypothetical protein
MDMYDFGGSYAQTYTETCECNNIVEVSTQGDDTPEYHTDVYVRCACCGRSVAFSLPVN